jgi:hypothetical protein
MSELKLALREERTSFEPRDEVVGAAYWKLDKPAEAVELRLFWFTRGKGTEDARVVETVRFDNPQIEEARQFRFRLPEGPYSFSGRLISLLWAIELVVMPSKEVRRVEITMGPDGAETVLGGAE